jgi:hypothetical protein
MGSVLTGIVQLPGLGRFDDPAHESPPADPTPRRRSRVQRL